MEHISKKENTPKEGYLTKETAREAALTMQYKYGESFTVYKCQQCGKFHIGRNGGIRMENDNQNRLETETQPEPGKERPFYICISSVTSKGFLDELNKAQQQGYKPIRDWYDEIIIEQKDGTEYTQRSVICYDTEATGIQDDEKSKRLDIIDALEDAEHHAYKKKSLLNDRENYLLMNTNWDELNEERKEKGQIKITNDKLRHAYMKETDKQYCILIEETQEAEEWLTRVKKSEALRELPQGKPPWELEEDQAQVRDEKASQNITPEKVQNIPESKRAHWHPDDLKAKEEAE